VSDYSQTAPQSSSDASCSTLPPSYPPSAASFCVATDCVDLQASNKFNQNLEEKFMALDGWQNKSSPTNVNNIYDTINIMPTTFQISATSRQMLPSPPEAAAASGIYSDVSSHCWNWNNAKSKYEFPEWQRVLWWCFVLFAVNAFLL